MSIRKIVVAAVAAIALTAGAAQAETALSGLVDANVALVNFDDDAGNDDDVTNYSVGGAVAFAVSDSIGMQIDARATFLDDDIGGGDDDAFSGTAHLFHRNADMLIGGFLGAVNNDDDTTWGGGIEAASYNDAWVFNGRLTYATNDDTDTDLWLIDGSAEYFFNENLATEFGLGFGNQDNGGGDSDFWNVNAGVQYQLASVPVGFTAGVSYTDFDDAGFSETALTVGVNYVFSGESLHERTTSGASQRGFLSSLGL